MARVIDLGAALAGRGFPALTRAEVDLLVDDPEVPRNTGRWTLSVAAGSGAASRADATPLDTRTPGAGTPSGRPEAATPRAATPDGERRPARVSARGLSALWCGWSTSRLRQAGLLTGGTPDDDAALDAIFAATPYLTEYF